MTFKVTMTRLGNTLSQTDLEVNLDLLGSYFKTTSVVMILGDHKLGQTDL